ncbi:MAG: hypothetical protein H6754_01805 [Candidatus Omnitrophica bacterium]|nr:hypothetical protein [Candidatus Omnitrophota bacterium]
MASIFPRKAKSKDTILHEFMFLEAPIEAVSAELIAWGESTWWPQDSLWKYIRQTDGPVAVGTQYVIKINKKSAPDWAAEVTQLLPNRVIERTFTKGLFKGFERIMMEERANGTRVDYELHFQIRGPLNLILWPLVLRKQYVSTIKTTLDALRNFLIAEAKKHL